MRKDSADVVVIGAGAIGCSIARELAHHGADVIAVERDSPGRRATWAAAGMLSPFGETGDDGPFLDLADESLRRFGAFADALQSETGIAVEYRTSGTLHVSVGDADDDLARMAARPAAARFNVRLMDAATARRTEPALSAAVTAGLLVGRAHRVNNRLLAQALLASATAAGARFRTANVVAEILMHDHAVAGVRLASGEQIAARHVVLAAGAWSGQIAGLPRPVPVRPVKGQMFAVDGKDRSRAGSQGNVLEHVVFSRRCYIIPRDDGRLLVGATVEDVGFRKGPTPRGIAELIAAAGIVLPVIEEMPLVETWAGFRPATPDHMPVIGRDPDLRGLIYATGHFRNGILLAPITAESVRALIAGDAPPVALAAFGIERFAPGPVARKAP